MDIEEKIGLIKSFAEEIVSEDELRSFCHEKKEEDNPVLEYARYIIFEKFDKIIIRRDENFGGNLTVKNYDALKGLYLGGKIHPLDLKNAVAEYINELLSPIREHFKKNQKAKKLLEKVNGFEITR